MNRTRTILFTVAVALAGPAFSPSPSFAQGGFQSPAQRDAIDQFKKAKALYDAKNCKGALPLFQQSNAQLPSPNSLMYIARCQDNLGDPITAYETYSAAIRDAKARGDEKYKTARETSEVEQSDLAKKLTLLRIEVRNAPGAGVRIGPRSIPAADLAAPVPALPGAIELILDGPSGPVTKSVTGAPGQTVDVVLDGAPPAANPGPDTSRKGFKPTPLFIGGLAAAGLGVGGMLMFAISGSQSQATYDSLLLACGGTPCSDPTKADPAVVSRGKTEQVLANVGLGVGLVGLAAGGTLMTLGLLKKPAATQARVLPVVAPNYVGVAGSF